MSELGQLPATLQVEEAGACLSLSRSSAYLAARVGVIPTVRVGRRLVVPTAVFLHKFQLIDDGGAAHD